MKFKRFLSAVVSAAMSVSVIAAGIVMPTVASAADMVSYKIPTGLSIVAGDTLVDNDSFKLVNTRYNGDTSTINSSSDTPKTSEDLTVTNSTYADTTFMDSYNEGIIDSYYIEIRNQTGKAYLTYTAKESGKVTVYMRIGYNKKLTFGATTTDTIGNLYDR